MENVKKISWYFDPEWKTVGIYLESVGVPNRIPDPISKVTFDSLWEHYYFTFKVLQWLASCCFFSFLLFYSYLLQFRFHCGLWGKLNFLHPVLLKWVAEASVYPPLSTFISFTVKINSSNTFYQLLSDKNTQVQGVSLSPCSSSAFQNILCSLCTNWINSLHHYTS